MSEKIKILFFTKGESINPASRYRFLQYIPGLEKRGFHTSVLPLFPESYYKLSNTKSRFQRIIGKGMLTPGRFFKRIFDIRKAKSADLVVIENQLFPYEQGLLERFLFSFGKKTIIEFDDAIYLTTLHYSKLKRTLKKADHVIVGNKYLAEFAERFNANVSVVPTVIDMDKYPERKTRKVADKIRIGWIGLPSTMKFLLGLETALAKLAQSRNIELVVISSKSLDIKGVPVCFEQWSEEDEGKLLANLDIGIMPLPDTQWTRGKCGAKLLQYMAAGLPAVASPVGVNSDIIIDGTTGFLASSDDEWFEALKKLCDSYELRCEMGRLGKIRVLENYSLQEWTEKLAQVYQSVLKR